MSHLFFLLRYAPFWAIPLLIIFMELTYIYWIRKRKKLSCFFMILGLFCLAILTYYYYAGGPEESVRVLRSWPRGHLETF